MVVELALVIALLVGVCLGFWQGKAWSTTTRASKETTAMIGTHCERGYDDGKEKGEGTDKDNDIIDTGTGRDTDTDTEPARTRQGFVWVNKHGRVYHTTDMCRYVCRSSRLVELFSLPSPPWRLCVSCVGYMGPPRSLGLRARVGVAHEASDDGLRNGLRGPRVAADGAKEQDFVERVRGATAPQ